MEKFTEAEKLEVLEREWQLEQMNPPAPERDWYAFPPPPEDEEYEEEEEEEDPYAPNELGEWMQRGWTSDGNPRMVFVRFGF